MKLGRAVAVFVVAIISVTVWALGAQHKAAAATHTAAVLMTDGEVKKIDLDAGKITIKHGEIKHLEMPPMTMVFRVADPKTLDQVKAGDKVRFVVDKVDGQYTVTKIEPKN